MGSQLHHCVAIFCRQQSYEIWERRIISVYKKNAAVYTKDTLIDKCILLASKSPSYRATFADYSCGLLIKEKMKDEDQHCLVILHHRQSRFQKLST